MKVYDRRSIAGILGLCEGGEAPNRVERLAIDRDEQLNRAAGHGLVAVKILRSLRPGAVSSLDKSFNTVNRMNAMAWAKKAASIAANAIQLEERRKAAEVQH